MPQVERFSNSFSGKQNRIFCFPMVFVCDTLHCYVTRQNGSHFPSNFFSVILGMFQESPPVTSAEVLKHLTQMTIADTHSLSSIIHLLPVFVMLMFLWLSEEKVNRIEKGHVGTAVLHDISTFPGWARISCQINIWPSSTCSSQRGSSPRMSLKLSSL